MAELNVISDDGTCRCSECEMEFLVYFDSNPVYDSIWFCPFCGVEGVVVELLTEGREKAE